MSVVTELHVQIEIDHELGEDLDARKIERAFQGLEDVRFLRLNRTPGQECTGVLTMAIDVLDLAPEDWPGEDIEGVLEALRCELGDLEIAIPTSYRITNLPALEGSWMDSVKIDPDMIIACEAIGVFAHAGADQDPSVRGVMRALKQARAEERARTASIITGFSGNISTWVSTGGDGRGYTKDARDDLIQEIQLKGWCGRIDFTFFINGSHVDDVERFHAPSSFCCWVVRLAINPCFCDCSLGFEERMWKLMPKSIHFDLSIDFVVPDDAPERLFLSHNPDDGSLFVHDFDGKVYAGSPDDVEFCDMPRARWRAGEARRNPGFRKFLLVSTR
jgi:hypothetical protein